MTELYRLRSMDKLFGEYQELEKQSIYFASPEELNDPMEGFRDIVWQGDSIVWTNLFRHYLYCLHLTYVHIKIIGGSMKVEPQYIPVRGMDQQLTPKAVTLFEDLCNRVFDKTNLPEFIEKIVNSKRKVHYDELLLYLQPLHFTALHEVQHVHIDHGLAPECERWEEPTSAFKHAHNLPDLGQKIEDEKLLNTGLSISSRMMAGMLLSGKYNAKSESKGIIEENRQLLIFDFPRAYIKQLEQLLYPDWYVACFMKNYRNSSTWGHYGDNNKGVCLIFEAEMIQGACNLTLNQMGGLNYKLNQATGHWEDREIWSPSRMAFHEVSYRDKTGEIDFFRSIGWLPVETLKKVWYRDQNGNLSECGSYLGTKDDEKAWRNNYWIKFYRDITVKTRDWEYEQESRLILHSIIADLSEGRRRTLTYNFNSLKGIIFGISTPDNYKLKIIEAIHNKCRENKRTDFDFFQAYYCHETGEIKKDKLLIKFSV